MKWERNKNRKLIYFMQVLEKGSYTVEATVIMGVTFLVIATVLYLCSFLYGRATMTSSAYEQAFTGRLQAEYGLFGFDELERSYSFEEKANTVGYSGSCFSVWGGFSQAVEIKAVVEKEKPVTFIRRLQAVAEIAGK